MPYDSPNLRLHPHELSNVIKIIGRNNLLEAIYIYLGGFQHALLEHEISYVDRRSFINLHELLSKERKEPLDRYLNLQFSLQGLFLIYTKAYLILEKEKDLDAEKVIQKIYQVFTGPGGLAQSIADSLEEVILSQMSVDEKCKIVDIIKDYILKIQAAQFGLNSSLELLATKEPNQSPSDNDVQCKNDESVKKEIIKIAIQRTNLRKVIIDFIVKIAEQNGLLNDQNEIQNSRDIETIDIKNMNIFKEYKETVKSYTDNFIETIEQTLMEINSIKLINILINPKGKALMQDSHDFEEKILKNVRRLGVQNKNLNRYDQELLLYFKEKILKNLRRLVGLNKNLNIYNQELLLSQELIQLFCAIHNIKVNKEFILLLTLNYTKDHYKELGKCIKNRRYLDIETRALLCFMMISKDMFSISLTQSSDKIVDKFESDFRQHIFFDVYRFSIISNRECVDSFCEVSEKLEKYLHTAPQNEKDKTFKLKVAKKIKKAIRMLDLPQNNTKKIVEHGLSQKYKIAFSVFYGLILSTALYYYTIISDLSTLFSSSKNIGKNIAIDLSVDVGMIVATAVFINYMLPKKEKVNSYLNESESIAYKYEVEKETLSIKSV